MADEKSVQIIVKRNEDPEERFISLCQEGVSSRADESVV